MPYGQRTFRGRSIFLVSRGYPAVYWPGHPTANAAHIVCIHRVVAFEAFGDDVRLKHVHHKNGDVWDWRIRNLTLMTPSEHGREHTNKPVESECKGCGRSFLAPLRKRRIRVYCTAKCRMDHTQKAEWPETRALWEMAVKDGYEAVGRELGVTGSAVKKRLRCRGYAAGRTPKTPL